MNAAQFRCMLCGASAGEAVFRDCADHYLGKPFRVDYWRCGACSLVQQSPVPADTRPFYDGYPIHAPKSGLYGLLRALVMRPIYFRPTGEQRTVVDFGCGDGSYLESLAGKGLTLAGFEPDAAHARRLSDRLGVPVFADKAALLAALEGKADAVTMHFVLEHVTDIDGAIEDARRLLRPGGVLWIVVPRVSSWEARLFGRKWHGLDPPRHVSFPERSVLRRLAEAHGFESPGFRHVAFPNGIAGSLPVVFSGKFRFPLFALFLPLGIVVSRLVPTGSLAATMLKRGTDRALRAGGSAPGPDQPASKS